MVEESLCALQQGQVSSRLEFCFYRGLKHLRSFFDTLFLLWQLLPLIRQQSHCVLLYEITCPSVSVWGRSPVLSLRLQTLKHHQIARSTGCTFSGGCLGT